MFPRQVVILAGPAWRIPAATAAGSDQCIRLDAEADGPKMRNKVPITLNTNEVVRASYGQPGRPMLGDLADWKPDHTACGAGADRARMSAGCEQPARSDTQFVNAGFTLADRAVAEGWQSEPVQTFVRDLPRRTPGPLLLK
ncbi:MAG: hypothetical protein HZA93_20485 [Verrucomicrobia bacterium]|nr:hypothetical protein [Verrucomicrobiota bacterium]